HPPLAWWESSWGHLGLDAFLIGAFAFAGLRAPRRGSPTATRAIRIASAAAGLAVFDTTVHLSYLSVDTVSGARPAVGNRAGVWAPRRGSPTATRAIRIASVAAVLAVFGTTVYLGYLSIDPMSGAGPVLGNRAVIWLGLQALALVGLGGTLISAVLELRGAKG